MSDAEAAGELLVGLGVGWKADPAWHLNTKTPRLLRVKKASNNFPSVNPASERSFQAADVRQKT